MSGRDGRPRNDPPRRGLQRREFFGVALAGAVPLGCGRPSDDTPAIHATSGLSALPGNDGAGRARRDPIVLANEHMRVSLDPDFPRVFAYHVPGHPGLLGALPGEPPVIELNGTPHPDFHVETRASAEQATYALNFPTLPLRLTFTVALERGETVLRLVQVEEGGAFELATLSFPGQYLVRLPSTLPGATLYRGTYRRFPWDDRWYRGGYLFSEPHYVSLTEQDPEEAPVATNWAALYADGICATIYNTIGTWKLQSQLLGHPGRTSAAALWNGVYYYRAAGEVQPRFESRVGIITRDANRDGRVDWMEAALWHRRFLPAANPLYTGAPIPTIVYRVIHAWAPPNNEVLTTFEEVLPIVRSVAEVTGGAPQVVYLTGWQYEGHDSGWPALDKVNPALGGRETLDWLVREAKRYNAVISYHLNLDDAYREHPNFDERVLCSDLDGKPYPWCLYEPPGVPLQAYHISHTKEVESGYFERRMRAFLAAAPVEKTVHLDAFRYSNVSFGPDRMIGVPEEWAATQAICRWLNGRGIDATTETPHDGYYGTVSWTWNYGVVLDGDPFHTLMVHGKLYGTGGATPRAELLGSVPLLGFSARAGKFPPPAASVYSAQLVCDAYHLGVLTQHYLGRKELLWLGEDGGEAVARLSGNCEGRAGKRGTRITDGDVLIRDGTSVCIPLGDTEVRFYSKEAQTRTWTLPGGWAGRTVQLVELGATPGPVKTLRLAGNRLTVMMAAGRPYAVRKL